MTLLILGSALLIAGVAVGVVFAKWTMEILQDYDDDVWDDEDW
jgi:hypothetical protein